MDVKALRKLIEESGVSFSQSANSWIFTCPKCEKKNKLYIRKKDGRFVCWVCAETEGYKGAPEYALKDLLDLPISHIKTLLYGGVTTSALDGMIHVTIRDPYEPRPIDDDEDGGILKQAYWPIDYLPIDEPGARKGLDYVSKRGIDLATAIKYQLRYSPTKRRVAFPIVVGGILTGWQARAIGETCGVTDEGNIWSTPKILTSPGVDREHLLMYQDNLIGSPHAVICEGPVDGIKADLCGGNVVTMGKAVSSGQIKTLLSYGVSSIYLALDPDAAAEIPRLISEFGDIPVYNMEIPKQFKDIGEMSPSEVLELFRSAKQVSAASLFVYLE